MESRHLSCVIAATPTACTTSPPTRRTCRCGPRVWPGRTSGVTGTTWWSPHRWARSGSGSQAPNPYGVLDHEVCLPSGSTVTNTLRVIAHPDGAKVVFTVRQLDLTDEEFERDCRTVAADLAGSANTCSADRSTLTPERR